MSIGLMVIELYEEMFRQCTLNSSFVMSRHKNHIKIIASFVKWLKDTYEPHQITPRMMIQYFEFQFSRYGGTKSKNHGKNKIMVSWVLGKKAIEAWENRDITKKWYIKYKLNHEVVLRLRKKYMSKEEQEHNKQQRNTFLQINDYEEENKQRFYNTIEGFSYCTNMTTMYHQQSKWCQGCEFAEDCIEIQQQLYPKLQKSRKDKYGEKSEQ